SPRASTAPRGGAPRAFGPWPGRATPRGGRRIPSARRPARLDPRAPGLTLWPMPLPDELLPDEPNEADIALERLRTALAELQDAKLRLSRDAQKQRERLAGEVLARLLPILDNLER